METLCAFLNGEGGTVLFGVADNGKITGQEVSDKTKREIAEAIRLFEPFATITVSYANIPDTDKQVIALYAEEQRYMRPVSYTHLSPLQKAEAEPMSYGTCHCPMKARPLK